MLEEKVFAHFIYLIFIYVLLVHLYNKMSEMIAGRLNSSL